MLTEFHCDPTSLCPKFESPKLKAHGSTVVSTVGKAVGMLGDLDALVPVLTALGTKHVEYGIKVHASCGGTGLERGQPGGQ